MFTTESVRLTNALSKETQQKFGIFFTPGNVIDYVFKFTKRIVKKTASVLEPSAGSGEFLRVFCNHYHHVDAYEINDLCIESLRAHFPNSKIHHQDFLKSTVKQQYDLIIGNPPYFTVKRSDYSIPNTQGRPNIYVLFILKCLELLKPNTGVLSFVLPTNFLNSSYYDGVRRYINETCTILGIMPFKTDFLNTKQEIVVFTLKKKQGNNTAFVLEYGGVLVFNSSERIARMKELLYGSVTIASLGCKVQVGNIVWNQHKKNLRSTGKLPIVYPSDVPVLALKLPLNTRNPEKKRYVLNSNKFKPFTRHVLVVSRGYGNNGSLVLKCGIVRPVDNGYLVENHLLCVSHKHVKVLEKIRKDLTHNPRTLEFISLYCTNAALNVHELKEIIPIYN
jgi:tRNA1(Val) A37 N6-methylase TrmN6